MNLPNKMTLLRIILIPVFMVVLYWGFPGATWVALAIFIIASLTDMLDGKIARKYNLVTDFGKFADPLADKMLVTAAMLWFVEIGQMPAWMLLIVICREFAVSGLRMIGFALKVDGDAAELRILFPDIKGGDRQCVFRRL